MSASALTLPAAALPSATRADAPAQVASRAARPRATAGKAARLEALAFDHGTTYDAYLATEPDRQVFWGHDVPGAVAYVRAGRHVHVAGGLLAAAADKPALLEEIVRWADRDQLVLAFYNLADEDLPLVRSHGFQVTKWGEEAIVDLPEQTFGGKPFEWVRRQTNFCRRQGLAVRECDRAVLGTAAWQAIAAELLEISRARLTGTPQGNEIHFLEGRFDPEQLHRRRLFVAMQAADHGAAGVAAGRRIEGFLVCNPYAGGSHWAFETYRRRDDAVRRNDGLPDARSHVPLAERGCPLGLAVPGAGLAL